MKTRINSDTVTRLQSRAVERWHHNKNVQAKTAFEKAVLNQHSFNYDLWHKEDQARRTDVTDAIIAGVKRAIDKLNQNRNDAIEALDVYLMNECERLSVKPCQGARLNSETMGSIIDRLSILSLRLYHMKQEAARKSASSDHKRKCLEKVAVMLDQQNDLSIAFNELIQDIFSGAKRIRVYRQFKMYNDPSLNPAVYAVNKSPLR